MDCIKCVNEENVKILLNCILKHGNTCRPINGAVLNIILYNLFEPIPGNIYGNLDKCKLQNSTVFNINLEIFPPLVIKVPSVIDRIKNQVENIANKNFTYNSLVYDQINKNSYYLNSFSESRIIFPSDVDLNEFENFSNCFVYYNLKENAQIKQKLEREEHKAVSEFYHRLLLKNSTAEGSLIQIYVFEFLFNRLTPDNNISSENLDIMKDFISDELQNLDENKLYKIDNIDKNYKTDNYDLSQFNELEFKILKSFINAFNNTSSDNKLIIKKIFNEKSKDFFSIAMQS